MATPPQQVEQYVLLASDASNPQQQQQANAYLHHWRASSDENDLATTFLQLVRSTQHENVLFYALTTFLQLQTIKPEQRAALRQNLFQQLLVQDARKNTNGSSDCWNPPYLRTKVGVLLARFLQLDFPHAWPTAFRDLQEGQLLQSAPDIFLRTLVALMDDFGQDENESNTRLKDILRGGLDNPALPLPPQQSISAQLLTTSVSLLAHSLETTTNEANNEAQQICMLSLTVLKGFCAWVDLSLLLDDKILELVFVALARASTEESPTFAAGVIAMECLQEMMARGMHDDKKIGLLVHTNILAKIHERVNLKRVDASPIEVVLEVAKFINRTGLEVFPAMKEEQTSTGGGGGGGATVLSQLMDLFLRCFAYDDIDVSGAVIPLAGALVSQQQQQQDGLLSQLLSINYRQMRYPADFQYDYEDEDEAEEEMYRTELRKLNQKFIRVAPDACLQFTCQALSQLSLPLSTAPTPDMEAALRLVYHYCEGIRPPPGMKVVMRNETFCNLLVALHTSDITLHSHREVLNLYYETAVRYHPLLKERPDLLQKVLESITGSRGLQHGHPRVRSRCCYLLLRLVKSVGGSGGTNSVLRPYVETAVSGIQGLLDSSNNNVQLRPDDSLYLFETIGLLLGKTGLEPSEQQHYLTQLMTPHVCSIQQVLDQRKAIAQDPDLYGGILSGSIAAIAFLSKGFKQPPDQVQVLLLETVSIALAVLEALPGNQQVRNKSFILIQRMIQCLETKVLPFIPRLLFLLIEHCTTEDVLDVAQLFNQLCIKYKGNAVSAIDGALLPYLRKCHALVAPLQKEQQSDIIPPHLRTEQLSIQKLTFVVLQHIVIHGATDVLLSPTNAASLESILQTMSEGAIHVEDPNMKKTCLNFFRELLSQWVERPETNGKSGTNGTNGSDHTNSSNKRPQQQVVQGAVRFACEVLVPGVIQSFFDSGFNEQDAMQWRSISELGQILHLLQQRVPDGYQHVLVVQLSGNLACPLDLLGSFRKASVPKEIEICLKEWIQIRKNKN
jgi:exportin-T